MVNYTPPPSQSAQRAVFEGVRNGGIRNPAGRWVAAGSDWGGIKGWRWGLVAFELFPPKRMSARVLGFDTEFFVHGI